MPYTVVAGDTLTSLARKFNTTRKHLKSLNNLSASKLMPGQVLQIPSTKKPKSASTVAAAAKPKHSYLMAQPVQDFDVPASTFGSCPVPLPSPEDDEPAATTDSGKPAPIAKLVSPAEVAQEEAAEKRAAALAASQAAAAQQTAHTEAPAPRSTNTFAASNEENDHVTRTAPAPAPSFSFSQRSNPRAPMPAAHSGGGLSLNPFASTTQDDWGNKFLREARWLGNEGIEYDDDWRPPGESRSWTMDCSNTSRYLYKVTAGILLPRTASDQYYYLHLQGKAWDVPVTSSGLADTEYLRHHLRPGDLLFWENTYRPERQPPITHVMVFLGTNDKGEWIMAGSQSSRGGEHNRRNGGPDVYVFRPSQPCGGYTTWMGLVHHQGRFCAYGRPLDADRSKLSVADDN